MKGREGKGMEQKEKIKRRYDRLAKFFDWLNPFIRQKWRRTLVENLSGQILEVGVGAGANLPYYSKAANVTAIDFSPKMLQQAAKKVPNCKAKITLKEMDIENMDFPDHTFDVVVSTCAFCSVPNPVQGLREIRRVVKPKGKVVMLEHMRSENKLIGLGLDCINPLTVKMIGTNFNRRTIQNIKKADLKVVDQTYLMTSMVRKLILSPGKNYKENELNNPL